MTKLTRPTIKKLLKLYMTPEYGSNYSFVKEAVKTFELSEDELHSVWNAFDTCYELWLLRKVE